LKPEAQLFEDRQPKTSLPDGARACVPQLVAQWAQATPQATAVSSGAEMLSYEALDRRANRLARHLRGLGVGADRLVGVYLERSPESVIAALAVFKAGGAYLPLDPALPAERLAYMLTDANVSAVITHAGLSANLPQGEWPVVAFDGFEAEHAGSSTESLEVEVLPEHLAYVIYTSGSTGRPKGVEIEHSSLLNLVQWHVKTFGITPTDRASLQAAVGFDAAVWELWPYLASGASVCIPEPAVRNHPEALRDWLIANGITVTFLATALAEQMLLLPWAGQCPLRILLTGADALRRRPGAEIPFRLVNNYGPTECAVVATSGVVLPDASATALPTIGRAIDNTEIHILDEKMRAVEAGEAGEIYIGGAGVARGYRNNPALTGESFVADPVRNGSSGRLYRTGDVGRFLANGEIEFLGRVDDQMKLRGFRVEPGEIVSALNLHAGVQASAVSLQSRERGEKRLVAYLVITPGASVRVAELRETLSRRLPEYMVPAVFVKIKTLPLTINGKVDQDALPVPSAANMLEETEFVAPRTLVEQRLAGILAPLLHVDQVSVKDNFFLLGGHSLLGTQLLTKIRDTFGVELSLLSLFDHPTLEEMSVEVENLILAKVTGGNGANGSTPAQSTAERSQ